MLFSDSNIARFISENFEPVWESVRPVPTVRIDFGNGRVVTRTLHGNIATYICSADGQVLDILPGIYDPATYADQLQQLSLLAKFVANYAPGSRGTVLASYHSRQASHLSEQKQPDRFVLTEIPKALKDMTKARIERPALILLRPVPGPAGPVSKNGPAESAAANLLETDSHFNETVRRQQIHAYLAQAGQVTPPDLTKWLYRDVLHSDLDDPYLGLGETLFSSYPFPEKVVR
ncbi:MAG TPA: hypothetical protein V6D08_06750 [Candidatus Obscuribacterales bacterium]